MFGIYFGSEKLIILRLRCWGGNPITNFILTIAKKQKNKGQNLPKINPGVIFLRDTSPHKYLIAQSSDGGNVYMGGTRNLPLFLAENP